MNELTYNSERKCWESDKESSTAKREWNRDFRENSSLFQTNRINMVNQMAQYSGGLTNNISMISVLN